MIGIDSDGDGLSDCVDPDDDNDGTPDTADCAPQNPGLWSVPGEVRSLMLGKSGDTTNIHWNTPANPGGTTVFYDTIRSLSPGDFVSQAECLETDDPSDNEADDPGILASGKVAYYAEIGLTTCHDYDKLRKKMIGWGVKENELASLGLEAIEKRATDVRKFVEIHEIRY